MTHSSLPPHTWRIAMVVFATIMVIGVGVGGAVAKWSQSASVSVQVSTGAWSVTEPSNPPSPSPNPNECSMVAAPVSGSWLQWKAGTTFKKGDRVVHNGKLFEAVWDSVPNVPTTNLGAWGEIVTNMDGMAIWTASRDFRAEHIGNLVCYQGKPWRVLWGSRGQTPDPSNIDGAWEQMLIHADGRPIWTSTRVFRPGDVVHHSERIWVSTATDSWRGREPGKADMSWAWRLHTG